MKGFVSTLDFEMSLKKYLVTPRLRSSLLKPALLDRAGREILVLMHLMHHVETISCPWNFVVSEIAKVDCVCRRKSIVHTQCVPDLVLFWICCGSVIGTAVHKELVRTFIHIGDIEYHKLATATLHPPS